MVLFYCVKGACPKVLSITNFSVMSGNLKILDQKAVLGISQYQKNILNDRFGRNTYVVWVLKIMKPEFCPRIGFLASPNFCCFGLRRFASHVDELECIISANKRAHAKCKRSRFSATAWIQPAPFDKIVRKRLRSVVIFIVCAATGFAAIFARRWP
jgi:hypothetical protein